MEQPKKEELSSVDSSASKIEKAPRGFFWFVAKGSLLKGPYSTTELKSLLDKKEVSEKFFAWRDGYHEWRPLYGIEEFRIEKENAEDLSYPTVAVPGVHSAQVTAPTVDPTLPHKVPIYKVRFNRSRWSDLKKTEVVVLFFTSLVFTLAIVSLAFYVFEKEWEWVWGKRTSSMLYSVGQSEDPLPVYFLGPLQSAPGLAHQEENFVAIEVESDMDRYDATRFAGQTLQSYLPATAFENLKWDKSNTYIRRMRVQGYIDLKNPAVLHVEPAGSPYEPVASKRLSK